MSNQHQTSSPRDHARDHAQCRELLGSLSDYVDGDLADEICAEIERHMAGCERCRIVVDTLRKTVELYHIAADAPAALPPDVRRRLFFRLDLEQFVNRAEPKGAAGSAAGS